MRKLTITSLLLLLAASIALMSACGGGGGDSSSASEAKENMGWMANSNIREALAKATIGTTLTGHVQFANSTDEYKINATSEETKKANKYNWSFGSGCMKAVTSGYEGLYKSGLGWICKLTGVGSAMKGWLGSTEQEDPVVQVMSKLDEMNKKLDELISDSTSNLYSINKLSNTIGEYKAATAQHNITDYWSDLKHETENHDYFFTNYKTLSKKIVAHSDPTNIEIIEYIKNDDDCCLFFTDTTSYSNTSLLWLASKNLDYFITTQGDRWGILGGYIQDYIDYISTNLHGENIVLDYYSCGAFISKMVFQSMTHLQKAYNIFAYAIILNAYDHDTFSYEASKLPEVFWNNSAYGTKEIEFPIYSDAVYGESYFDEENCKNNIQQALMQLGENFTLLYINELNTQFQKLPSYQNGDIFAFLENADPIHLRILDSDKNKIQPLAYISNFDGDTKTDMFIADYFTPEADESYFPWMLHGKGTIKTHQLLLNHIPYEPYGGYIMLNDLYMIDDFGLAGTINYDVFCDLAPDVEDYFDKCDRWGSNIGTLTTDFQSNLLGFPDSVGTTTGGALTTKSEPCWNLYSVDTPVLNGYWHSIGTSVENGPTYYRTTPVLSSTGHLAALFNIVKGENSNVEVLWGVEGFAANDGNHKMWYHVNGYGDQCMNAYFRDGTHFEIKNSRTELFCYSNSGVYNMYCLEGDTTLMGESIDVNYIENGTNYLSVTSKWEGKFEYKGRDGTFSFDQAESGNSTDTVKNGIITYSDDQTPIDITYKLIYNYGTNKVRFIVTDPQLSFSGTPKFIDNSTVGGLGWNVSGETTNSTCTSFTTGVFNGTLNYYYESN